MRPLPDQPQIVCVQPDVYEFHPFGSESCPPNAHDGSIELVRTRDGVLQICTRCSAVRFIPHELMR